MASPALSAPAFDDEEVRLLLAGTDHDVRRAITLIDQCLRIGCMAWAKQKCPWLQSTQLPVLWVKVLAEFHRKVSKDKSDGTFDLNKPLLPLLCTILHRRGIDVLRARTREAKRQEAHELYLKTVGPALQGTQLGQRWKATSEGERMELNQAILAAIAGLPEKQRIVCGIQYARLGELSFQELADEVTRHTGRPETVAAIKGSLQAGRKKVREFLQRRGFACGGDDE